MSDDFAALERELRDAAARYDPLPAHLPEQARLALVWRTVDAELAELVFDSSEAGQVALVRGVDQPRLLTFDAGELSVEVEIAGGRLVGQLVPAQPAEIELQRRGGQPLAVPSDELGRFTVDVSGGGPLRLCCRRAAGRQVVTDWFM